jgi:hypothetical protein
MGITRLRVQCGVLQNPANAHLLVIGTLKPTAAQGSIPERRLCVTGKRVTLPASRHAAKGRGGHSLPPLTNAQRQQRYRARQRAADESDPVASFVRAAIVTGRAALEKSRPMDVARRSYSDPRLDPILRAAQTPTALSNTPALSVITVALLDALVQTSAGVDLDKIAWAIGSAELDDPGRARQRG